jgi:hypothetical protein
MNIPKVPLMIFAALILFGIRLNGCFENPVREDGRYYDDKKGFSIRFPAGWIVEEEDHGETITALKPLDNEEVIFVSASVSTTKLPRKMDLNEFTHETKRWSFLGYEDVEQEEGGGAIVDNTQAAWMLYHYQTPDCLARTMGYCLVKGRRGYVVSLNAPYNMFPEHREELVAIAESFQFE